SVNAFTRVEAEINNDHNSMQRLSTMLNSALNRQISVYGPWIYDKGHCCQPEIHPAEQIWWSDPIPGGRVYYCNIFCDESKRFWWRDQMDDGTKLKPWGAPPITGIFAMSFEAEVNSPAKIFNIEVQDAYNHTTPHEDYTQNNLVYGGNTLVSVVQDTSNYVKVSFEKVGLVGTNTIRGFVVIEATVGKVIQNPNPITIFLAGTPTRINLPPNSDPDQVEQIYERAAFKKEGGRIMMTITQSSTFNPIVDLNGTWAAGGANGPVISVSATSINIDMSAYNRPQAVGYFLDNSVIVVNFPDDNTYSGRLQAPNTILWANGSSWTKA
ncbi:MAG: hypothetical protein ABIQ44_14920, partial [Chloroflexia bacterium]